MELRDRWFDDFEEGETFEIGPHLMTEERIVSFASEFDPQPFHVDPVAGQDSIYGGLIASGWHTGSVMMKLIASTLGESSLGSPGGEELRWVAPVRPGDELRLRVTIDSKRPSATKPDRGLLVWRNELYNHNDELVMSFIATMFIRRRR